jgi:Glycosyl transferase family 11
MQIVVRQISGLGNQLFQYAAGRYYAKKYDSTMRLTIESEEKAHSYGHPRPFLLSRFNISAPFDEVTLRDRLLLARRSLFTPISYLAQTALSVQIIREPWDDRYTFRSALPVKSGTQILYLVGYWQVYPIANAMKSELLTEFKLMQPPSGENLNLLSQIRDSRHPVSLHIRRGDYTHPSEGDIVLPLSYYFDSIRLMRKRLERPKFFVFSDDIGYAKEHLAGDADFTFVDHNDVLTAHEDLRLMSACQHHVIANSTLSWWGAWLNPSPSKIVIAPRRWRVGGCTETPDLFPPEWILLEG